MRGKHNGCPIGILRLKSVIDQWFAAAAELLSYQEITSYFGISGHSFSAVLILIGVIKVTNNGPTVPWLIGQVIGIAIGIMQRNHSQDISSGVRFIVRNRKNEFRRTFGIRR